MALNVKEPPGASSDDKPDSSETSLSFSSDPGGLSQCSGPLGFLS